MVHSSPSSPRLFASEAINPLTKAIKDHSIDGVTAALAHLTEDALFETLTKCNAKTGKTALMIAAQKFPEAIPDILNQMKPLTSSQQVQILQQVSINNYNILMLMCLIQPSAENLQAYENAWNGLCEMLKTLPENELLELILHQNYEGSALFYASKTDANLVNPFRFLLFLKEQVSIDAFKTIARQEMHNGWTIFQHGKLPQSIEDILITDFHEHAAWHILVYTIEHRPDCIERTFQSMEAVEVEDWHAIFSKENKNHLTPLCLAIQNGNKEIAQQVLTGFLSHINLDEIINTHVAEDMPFVLFAIKHCPDFMPILFKTAVDNNNIHLSTFILKEFFLFGIGFYDALTEYRYARKPYLELAAALLGDYFLSEQYKSVFSVLFKSDFRDISCNLLSLTADCWMGAGKDFLEILLRLVEKMPLADQAEMFGSPCKTCTKNIYHQGTPLDIARQHRWCEEAAALIATAMKKEPLHSYLSEHKQDNPLCKDALDALSHYHSSLSSCTIL